MAEKKKITKAKKEKKLLPFQDEAQLRDMHLKQKMTAMDIANEFGVKRHNVLFYLHKFNIPIWSKKKERKDANRSYRDEKWLKEQIQSGLSIHKIALSCNVSFMQIKNYCVKYGLINLVEQQRAQKKKSDLKKIEKVIKKHTKKKQIKK
ncbi:MAG: hypothetical protein ACFFDI_01070 [Promethearchaeota archaeon]